MTTLEASTVEIPTGPRARRALRSIGAVIGGLVATFVTTTAVDVVLHQTGVFPPMSERMADSLFVLALAYRIALNALGCVVAARLAPSNPRCHAYALGMVGVVLATLGAIAMGDRGPVWYSLANIAVALPCAWLGGRLGARARA
jgi:putative Mn2+ efflux pump MntP